MRTTLFLILMTTRLISHSQKPTDLIGIDSSKVNWDLLNTLVIQEINAERVKIGVHPLIMDSTIMAFSKKHTMWMVRSGKYEHSHSGIYAECCTMSYFCSRVSYKQCTKFLVDSWKSSKPHWEILMSSDYKKCGVHTYFYEYGGMIIGFDVKSTFNIK